MRAAVTGHQPHLLGGFGEDVAHRLRALARRWIQRSQPGEVICGMAPGWDLAMAEAALDERVPLVAALAWPDQGHNWPEDARRHLRALLERAATVHVAFPKRTPDMWTLRDRWVLERGDHVVALWSGEDGGTARAVAHARELGRPVENLWAEWCADLPRQG
ncbi:DUF1273 family protein [Pyxidicoccus fallax]|uniref:DUF1273 domain-containing protein n=1 Tax=Pyxidicoccus fallax TaxID=394095 RepID=A0A848L8K0_9BACT|nr:SLOG family protein [Pyxidicoccus fallax]NMO15139.1 DUF1273 domain-containing protein [Pyxidicoccus fallax]NPC77485.1 DUF1273 family protein [Pyxidicoccus fallax]